MTDQPDLFDAAAGVRTFWKRPVPVSAVQLTTENCLDVVNWIEVNGGKATLGTTAGSVVIKTLEGTILATPGDYIIRGIRDEFYPVKVEIFEDSYDTSPHE